MQPHVAETFGPSVQLVSGRSCSCAESRGLGASLLFSAFDQLSLVIFVLQAANLLVLLLGLREPPSSPQSDSGTCPTMEGTSNFVRWVF